MLDILVPIFVCVILPVSIIFIIAYMKMYMERKRSEILMKALETHNTIDLDKLINSLGSSNDKSVNPREKLNKRLLWGCVLSLTGLVLVVYGIISLCVLNDDDTSIFVPGGLLIALGLSFLIVYFSSRKYVIETEKDKLLPDNSVLPEISSETEIIVEESDNKQ